MYSFIYPCMPPSIHSKEIDHIYLKYQAQIKQNINRLSPLALQTLQPMQMILHSKRFLNNKHFGQLDFESIIEILHFYSTLVSQKQNDSFISHTC